MHQRMEAAATNLGATYICLQPAASSLGASCNPGQERSV